MGTHTKPVSLSSREAREFLVGHHGLKTFRSPPGFAGIIATLKQLRCIQLDPLDVMGTNADLVLLARVDGIRRGDVYRALFPGHAFEHFAKERCLLPASHFPWYRAQATETPWWRLSERKKRISPKILAKVFAEISERGPSTVKELTHHGKVNPIDWNGWKGTSNSTAMAVEILWTQCKIVVCGRQKNSKTYDLAERAFPGHVAKTAAGFDRWSLLERVEAAGLLSRNSGPHWSMLSHVRKSSLVEELKEEGQLVEVSVEGLNRRFLAPRRFLERKYPDYDDRLRLLGPLDPMLWDRDLVKASFKFEYIWEVYKPPAQRRWGWYVLPLFHRGKFVGRLEGFVKEKCLTITRLWREDGVSLDREALEIALRRHATACGAEMIAKLPSLTR
jgi:uncharacterized protein YcaQ